MKKKALDEHMIAIIYEKYGAPDVLKLMEIEKPVPKNNEILVKVKAASVTSGDWRMRKPDPFLARLVNGIIKPKRIPILGFELSGEVEAIGKDVTRFKIGDQVFAFTGFKFGAYAQYKCLSEDGVVALKPTNLTHEDAAAVPAGAATALSALRDKGTIKQGQNVLVYGASGSVGTYAVQLAGYFGATVTAVCSTANFELVKTLGATRVIDYKIEDFAEQGELYDLIFDAVGKKSFTECKKALSPAGRYICVDKNTYRNRKGRVSFAKKYSQEKHTKDLIFIKELIEAKKIIPVVDRKYDMSQIVDAHIYVESGHKKGNVVISISHNS